MYIVDDVNNAPILYIPKDSIPEEDFHHYEQKSISFRFTD